MFKELIKRLVEGKDLREDEAYEAMSSIMDGKALPTQIASFLTALRMKGETVPEITGFARAMRARALPIRSANGEYVVDTCGTGGDGNNTFNISTAVAFVAAGSGLTVAKHGNRSVSSQCGSADVLEALGVNINLVPERVERCLLEVGMAFLFAPLFHPAMMYAIGPRREMGFRTVFNLLGPLTNPAGANVQVIGVYRKDLVGPIAEVLRNLGCKGALVVHGEDHCDEISITGKTFIVQLQRGRIESYEVEPEDIGLKRRTLEQIRGGGAQENKNILLEILEGVHGPRREVVLLNASAVFMAAERVSNLRDGMEMAEESIDSGRAMRKLKELIQFTNREG
ncbi:MAG: anthranilate phosphoribosyltransferase [Thermodesulfobacteriota bacterium]|nr:anthranilate phosphoribosyltransferase [Thermodesulfobacteriota bacterium]